MCSMKKLSHSCLITNKERTESGDFLQVHSSQRQADLPQERQLRPFLHLIDR